MTTQHRPYALVEALSALAAISLIVGGVVNLGVRARTWRSVDAAHWRAARDKARLASQIEGWLSRVIPEGAAIDPVTDLPLPPLWTDEKGEKLFALFKPPLERVWSDGALCEGCLYVDERERLVLVTRPRLARHKSIEGRQPAKSQVLLEGAVALRFQFTSGCDPSAVSALWRSEGGELPAVCRCKIALLSGEILNLTHVFLMRFQTPFHSQGAP